MLEPTFADVAQKKNVILGDIVRLISIRIDYQDQSVSQTILFLH